MLPPPSPRKQLHTRNIHCQGFLREDGLWDIEACLVDTKNHPYSNPERGEIKPGEPVHEMHIRITVDLDMMIHEVASITPYTPFTSCPKASDVMKKLIGLKIGAGWLKAARQRIQNTQAQAENAWLISSNSFDVIGAVTIGMKAAWIQRSEKVVLDPWGVKPTITLKALDGLAHHLEPVS